MKLIKDEEEYINIYECIKICTNKSIEATVYLYKLIGDEKSALKICLKKIKDNYQELKSIKDKDNTCQNYSENSEFYKKRKNSLNLEEKNYEKNSSKNEMGEEYWLELFEEIYNILHDAEKKEGLIFSQIKNHLTEKIENLLITMSYYVSFNFILKNVSKEVEFSLIKKFLNKNINTKSRLSNLYKSYIKLISDKINKDFAIIEKNGQKGKNIDLIMKEESQIYSEKQNLIANRMNKYKFNYKYNRTKSFHDIETEYKNKKNKNKNVPKIFKKCLLCQKMFNFIDYEYNKENSDLIIFQCDHIYHLDCLKKEYAHMMNDLKYDIQLKNDFCPKCINIDTELFYFINENKNEINEIKDDDENDNINVINNNENGKEKFKNFSLVENMKKKLENKMKKKNFKKLSLFDNNYFEQINILEDTLNGI